VIKAHGRDILHKSDVGGVRLGIASEQAVRDGFAAIAAHLKDRLEAVLVQPMVTGGVEMVIGGVNDSAFGPVVMCGTGGVLVDVLDDTAFAMCPLSDAAGKALVEQIKGRVRLRGFRGSPAADEAAFCRLLVRVSHLLHTCPEIQEMDLNPVMVLSSGAVVVDARVRVGSKAPAPAGRRVRY
jgi:acyl-CoA synthetase (NDP forming)